MEDITEYRTFAKVVALQCVLAGLLHSSPVPMSISSTTDVTFMLAVDSANTLVEKILKYIPVAHRSTVTNAGLTLDSTSPPTNLQSMMKSLGIPAAPVLKPISERFTLEHCVSRIFVGVQLYHDLTDALATKWEALQGIHADLRDLRQQVIEMQTQRGLGNVDQYQRPDLASHLSGDYNIQVATHLTLLHLRSFCHDMSRSLGQVKKLVSGA